MYYFGKSLSMLFHNCQNIKHHIYNTLFRYLYLRNRRLHTFRVFSVGETKNLETVSAKIHGYGSVIGFLLLTLAPLLIGLYFFKISDGFLGVLSLICFILAIAFFVLFVMADKPNYKGTIIAFEGLWQRLSLLFMYCPIAILSLNITLRF